MKTIREEFNHRRQKEEKNSNNEELNERRIQTVKKLIIEELNHRKIQSEKKQIKEARHVITFFNILFAMLKIDLFNFLIILTIVFLVEVVLI